MAQRTDLSDAEAMALVPHIDAQYRPVWEGRLLKDQVALARYFLPHNSAKLVLEPSRPRVIKWYCPFAAQNTFPSGHRYCINVYAGCGHFCTYCYGVYEPTIPRVKLDYRRILQKDLTDLDAFDVPPAPLHMSNSTDCLQDCLEATQGDMLFTLQCLRQYRHRFTTITVLTKNPVRAAQESYLQALLALQSTAAVVQVEVSVALWREEARAAYEPGAPSIASRCAGVRALRAAGIPVVVRIDPLFPRTPLPTTPCKSMTDFGLVEAQPISDLENLVAFAKDVGAQHLVYSPAKIVKPHGRSLTGIMRQLRDVYTDISRPGKLDWHHGSWRLPRHIADEHVVLPFLAVCAKHGMAAKFCMKNLIETP